MEMYVRAETDMSVEEKDIIKSKIFSDKSFVSQFEDIANSFATIDNGSAHTAFMLFDLPLSMKAKFYETDFYKDTCEYIMHKSSRVMCKFIQGTFMPSEGLKKEGRGKNLPNPSIKEVMFLIELYFNADTWLGAVDYEKEYKVERSNAIRTLKELKKDDILQDIPSEKYANRTLYQLSEYTRALLNVFFIDVFSKEPVNTDTDIKR